MLRASQAETPEADEEKRKKKVQRNVHRCLEEQTGTGHRQAQTGTDRHIDDGGCGVVYREMGCA